MAITITTSAAQHIAKQLQAQPACVGLRLRVKPSGCSGYGYEVSYADAVETQDEVFDTQNVRVVIDRGSLVYLDGTEVDFVREGLNERFVFNNPNVKNACGCGSSFAV